MNFKNATESENGSSLFSCLDSRVGIAMILSHIFSYLTQSDR